MQPLNPGEIRNVIAFLNRVNLTGQEAITLALLQQKLGSMLAADKTVEPEKPAPEAEKGKEA